MEKFEKIMQEKPNQIRVDVRYEVVFKTIDGRVHVQPARNYGHAVKLAELAKSHPEVNSESVKVCSRKVD